MKNIITGLCLCVLFAACSDNETVTPPADDFATLQQTVLNDFTTKVAIPYYSDLDVAAQQLYTDVQTLNTTTTEENLTKAKESWKAMRTIWEQSEGYLFGPVEDNDYDPNMDTWPTDYDQLDSVLASSNALTVADIQSFTLSLRGYHPLEYILWGKKGNRTAAELTAREKLYMVSLMEDIKGTCHALYESWTAAPTNYANEVTTAGKGSSKYAKRQEVFIAINDAMTGICEEVGKSEEGTGKIYEPYIAKDSNIVESPYSNNSMIDFKNNIQGAYNVYLGKYKEQGKGISDLVKAKNINLDNEIKAKFEASIGSFSTVTVSFEDAIYTQRVQLQGIMDKLGALKEELDENLHDFIITNITD